MARRPELSAATLGRVVGAVERLQYARNVLHVAPLVHLWRARGLLGRADAFAEEIEGCRAELARCYMRRWGVAEVSNVVELRRSRRPGRRGAR
jgi:hypothetical protein